MERCFHVRIFFCGSVLHLVATCIVKLCKKIVESV